MWQSDATLVQSLLRFDYEWWPCRLDPKSRWQQCRDPSLCSSQAALGPALGMTLFSVSQTRKPDFQNLACGKFLSEYKVGVRHLLLEGELVRATISIMMRNAITITFSHVQAHPLGTISQQSGARFAKALRLVNTTIGITSQVTFCADSVPRNRSHGLRYEFFPF
jgi:hypothetical protein